MSNQARMLIRFLAKGRARHSVRAVAGNREARRGLTCPTCLGPVFKLSINRISNEARKSGFTLIELLVVVAIIAILAALLLATLNSAYKTAQSAKCKNNLHQLGLALKMYVNDYEAYPGGSRLPEMGDWVYILVILNAVKNPSSLGSTHGHGDGFFTAFRMTRG